MTLLDDSLAAISPANQNVATHTRRLLDAKTKPRGSLGRLEELACRLAAIYGQAQPSLPQKAIVVIAGDHGVSTEGVSAYPSEVTAQMVQNFVSGGAAINVLARQQHAKVVIVDMGVASPAPMTKQVRSCRLGHGTTNMTIGPAMPRELASRGIEEGIKIASDLISTGVGLIGLGEMGIGNTTAASAITAVMTGQPVERTTGRGTGIDDERFQHKIRIIERALAVNQPTSTDPLGTLAKVGGFEIAGLVGVIIGAAARRVPVVLDGFITGSAALIADSFNPSIRSYYIAAHRSVEQGHANILNHLGLHPLLDLDLRLGEGTGAALAMNLVDAALLILRDMATFSSAGVTDAGA